MPHISLCINSILIGLVLQLTICSYQFVNNSCVSLHSYTQNELLSFLATFNGFPKHSVILFGFCQDKQLYSSNLDTTQLCFLLEVSVWTKKKKKRSLRVVHWPKKPADTGMQGERTKWHLYYTSMWILGQLLSPYFSSCIQMNIWRTNFPFGKWSCHFFVEFWHLIISAGF